MLFMGFPSGICILAVALAANSWIAAQMPADSVGRITSDLRSHKFLDALHLLEPAIERNPKSAQLWTLRGIALSGTGDKKAALASFRHGLSLAPDYLPALEGAAQIEYESGAKEAIAHLRRILELRPDDPTSHAMVGVLAARGGDCATAVPHFEKSGTLLDSQPDAVRQYGACLVRLNQPEKAIGIFEHALSRSDTATTRYQLATVQMLAHRPKDAIETLQPSLQENAASSDVRELAATAYEEAGNTPEAVGILRQAIVADPHNVNLYLDFANISLDHQSYQVGVDMINAGLEAEPKAAPLYLARGILYVQLAQYDIAEADFTNANLLDPKQSMGSAAEGLAAVQQNDPESALLTVRTKLAKKPNDAFLLYLQAEILTQRGPDTGSAEFREAMESAKKAIALKPSLAAAHDILAKLYLQAGDNKSAAEQSRQALASDPKDQTALYRLIQALRKSGQNDDIPELLKHLAELRMESTKEEAEHNRYKLVEEKPFSGEIHP
jgi:tetratricopeptide (TPR) repeat protein